MSARTAAVPASQRHVRIIEPRRRGIAERWREFWRYRKLIGYFGKRYVQKSYLRTRLGWLWLPLRPVLDVGARVLIFGGILGASGEGVPYTLFFLVGMGVWQLFSSSCYWTTRSIELNKRVLTRIYIPRLTVLVAAVIPAVVNYLLYVAIAAVAVGYYWVADGVFYLRLDVATLLAPAGVALIVMLALGIGLWTSVYGARTRDMRFAIRYVLSFWFFLTPVIYPLSAVPSGYHTVASLNPMTAPIEMVREGLVGAGSVPLLGLAMTLVTIGALGASGLWHFGRAEAEAVDYL